MRRRPFGSRTSGGPSSMTGRCRGFVCICYFYACHRPDCPIWRPSRSLNYKKQWAWPRGDDCTHDADATIDACDRVTE
eukprot:6504597-Pyramimonas_sp.AAC.1